MARTIILLLLAVLMLALAIPAVVYFKALSELPLILDIEPADQEELMRVQQLIAQQVGSADAQGRVQLQLGQQDVNTAIEFAMLAGAPPMLEGVEAEIGDGTLRVRGNVHLPIEIPRRYLSYDANLLPDGKTPPYYLPDPRHTFPTDIHPGAGRRPPIRIIGHR